MAEQFLHGVEVLDIVGGTRPIKTVKSSVIGVVGTAPDADATAFPLNTPVLVSGNRLEAAKLDTVGDGNGTLPAIMDDIFDQVGAAVVVIRVDEGVDAAATQANIIGGVDVNTGAYTGMQALLAAQSALKVTPRILAIPGYTQIEAVLTALVTVAERLRAVIVADGPNTNDADALAYRALFGSERVYLVDPWSNVFDTISAANVVRPASARVAGMIAKSDNERGFWWSPSNTLMNGIVGTARPVDFTLGDVNCRANYLNENDVATIIQQDGYRLWGNHTCSSDPKWMFLSVVRTRDMINDSLLRAHMWAVDRNIVKSYVDDVVAGVNAYLRHLTAIGAILGGKCWADPELNTIDQIQLGKVYFDFDFTPPYPAEHVTFRSHMVGDYIEEIFK